MRPTADWTLLDLAHWWEEKAYTCLSNLHDVGTLSEIAEEYDRMAAYSILRTEAYAQYWRNH